MSVEILSSPIYSSHLDQLEQLIKLAGGWFEGNCVYEHLTYNRLPGLHNKQLNLLNISQDKKQILEIGFNAGHSSLLFLLSNNESKLQVFDLGEHPYTRSCFEYLNTQFPGRMSIIYGDSMITLPNFYTHVKYDLFHVDGGHSVELAQNDLMNCKRWADPNSMVVFDDVDFISLNRLYYELIGRKMIEPVNGFLDTKNISEHALCKFLF